MKTNKIFALGAGLLLSVSALAADPIVGTWKMSEKGEPKAILQIVSASDGYQAVMTKGLTEKAKKREGAVVIRQIKSLGNGKYEGKGKHPTLPISGTANITIKGNNITISSRAGTQTGVRQ